MTPNSQVPTNVVLWAARVYLDSMPRLSIDITPEEHQKLKAIAALKGQSIKDYVLTRTLSDVPDLGGMDEDEAFRALADFLKPRIEEAQRGDLSTRSIADIRREMRDVAGP
ncbi:MAG: antitoxin [Paracoccaceae bacterium]